MTVEQINLIAQSGLVGLLIIALGSIIKIPKLEINVWSWLGRKFGRAINGEIMEKVELMDEKLDAHIKAEEEENVRNIRQRILRFNDEILMGEKHSKEHFDEILSDIDVYEQYCGAHAGYKNNKANLAIDTIKDVYSDCVDGHSFLTYSKEVK